MNRKLQSVFLLVLLLLSVSLYSQKTYYVATNGSDKNAVTSLITPFATLAKAIKTVSPGDTIFLRSGIYTMSSTVNITKSGTASKHITLSAYKPDLTTAFNNNRPVLNYSVAFAKASSSERGVQLDADYWNVYGIIIDYAGDNGMNVAGHYCTINFCVFSHNRDAGLQLSGGASADTIINCDSYYNADLGLGTTSNGGNADGFAVKLDVGDSIYMRGCRSWLNSDDGYDGYLRPSTTSPQNNVTWTQEDCWAFNNGYYWLDGSTNSSMNGQGFKTGGSDTKDLAHNCIMKKCLSFYNKSNGYDQNSNAGTIAMYNCTSYGNLGSSIYMASPSAVYYPGARLILKNNLSLGGSVSVPNLAARPLTSLTNLFSKSTTSKEILYFDTTGAAGARGLDGSLPVLNFMRPNTAAAKPFTIIDKGTALDTVDYHGTIGIPYNGAAPDLGCYESNYGIVTPIKLTSFSATSQKESITLSWSTATELNNKGWRIERTADLNTWTTIGFVDGINGTKANDYTYNDKAVTGGVYYYRLKQIDLDGTFTYSNTITINVQLSAVLLHLSAFPNPFSSSTSISYSVPNKSKILISLYNNRGDLVQTIINESQQAGGYHQSISNKTLSVGTYYLTLQVGDKKEVIGLIKR